jgi:protein tyrosine phosphatase (PTP) superfamily phosphohydrolase (DUF442 family)
MKSSSAFTLLSIILLLHGCATKSAFDLSSVPPANELSPAIANSRIVIQNEIWRGARPSGKAPALLIESRVGTVVNLEWENDNAHAFEAARPNLMQPHTAHYFRIKDFELWPLLSWSKTDNNVAQFIAIARTQPKPIYVHCRSGQNRTGVMVAAYKIVQARARGTIESNTIDDIVNDMKSFGGFWASIDEHYLRNLSPSRIAQIENRVAMWEEQLQKPRLIKCANQRCSVE